MEPNEIEKLLHQWFDEVWNQKRPERIAEMLHPEVIAHGMGPNGTILRGPAAFEASYQLFISLFPDIQITVEKVVISGDTSAAYLTCRGTHSGDALGIPGTGKQVTFPVMTMARYKDGKIAEGWNIIDLLSVLRQVNPTTDVAATLP